ncbi:hypothetical protein [Hornefia butyriciproducens]|uniref:hypothetical protein n=1 Tax=Hornefia butyriciproducens TaxID=2652293 RepID=UPI0023F08BB9|nr:hypothetical protein [Hornefia butyriciproducens]MDD6299421.1 hypothetical protein [Hornefia butyriciproducens]
MKKIRCMVCIVVCLSVFFIMGVPTFAMDHRVSSSGHKAVTRVISKEDAKKHKHWKYGYYKGYAKGYVTSTYKHYANVKLYFLGDSVKSSGRKWGTGKVSVETGWDYNDCDLTGAAVGSSIFYGFSK